MERWILSFESALVLQFSQAGMHDEEALRLNFIYARAIVP